MTARPLGLPLALLAGLTTGCGARAEAGREERGPFVRAETRTAAAPEPAFLVLEQRDDRDVTQAESFVTKERLWVVVTYRQPNRPREAGMVVLLDHHGGGRTEVPIPARPEPSGPPRLRFLPDSGAGIDGAITDLVPEVDPLGGAMLGSVHLLRDHGRRVETRTMPRPPAGSRWAGPELVRLVDGQLRIIVRGAAGEEVFSPFERPSAAIPVAAAEPRAKAAGPEVLTETRCDESGCRTSLRLSRPATPPP